MNADLGLSMYRPENPLKKKTLTTADHLKLGTAQPTSGPWDQDEIPAIYDATRSIRWSIAVLAAHVDAKRKVAKRKESPTDGNEVDHSVSTTVEHLIHGSYSLPETEACTPCTE